MTEKKQIEVQFSSVEKQEWLRTISYSCGLNALIEQGRVVVLFEGVEQAEQLEPFHYVLFACFAEYYTGRECDFAHKTDPLKEPYHYMYEVLNFNRYWLDQYAYKDATDETVLNIWKVSDSEKEPHAQRIHDYLKRQYFADKDLSALKNGIIELYYNIIDHAKAAGNAFSFIRYDQQTHKLHFAVCDFGVGIAALIRQSPQYDLSNDAVAIVKALEPGVTSGSQSHNKGMGLDNIAGMLFDDNTMNIVSNRGQVVVTGNKKATESWENDFEFPGTLIWLDVSMDRFEKEERQDNFSWNDV